MFNCFVYASRLFTAYQNEYTVCHIECLPLLLKCCRLLRLLLLARNSLAASEQQTVIILPAERSVTLAEHIYYHWMFTVVSQCYRKGHILYSAQVCHTAFT